MGQRILLTLLAVSLLTIWGSTANATNRILGYVVRHSNLEIDVELCGNPLVDTEVSINGQVEVEIACQNPGGHVPNGKPGHPTFSFPFGPLSQGVPSADFTGTLSACTYEGNNKTTVRTFMVPLPSEVRCKPKWTKVENSELISVAATVAWSCTTAATGSECQNSGDLIEAISATCADTPHTAGGVPCDDIVEHVNHMEGAPPPPLPSSACVEILLHCDAGSEVLETHCGAGTYDLENYTADNISYVKLLGTTTSVVLNHCDNEGVLEIFGNRNLCSLDNDCCEGPYWNDNVCSVEIITSE